MGLIGTGKHGSRYARHIREDFPDLELVAIARGDPVKADATARQLGCRAYRDFRELLAADGIDAVIVVVPPTLHVDIVSEAARRGRPVLLEKPAAVSVAAGSALLAVVRRHPIPIMVAQTLRFNAVVRTLMAHRSLAGAIHSLCVSQRFERSRLEWLDDPSIAGGGMTLHTGVHSFDLLRLLTGMEADVVSCQMARVNTRRTEDSFAATIQLGGGAVLATVSGSRATGGRTGHVEVAGCDGVLIGNHVLNQAHLLVGNEVRPLPVEPPRPTVREVIREFVQALRAGRPMPVPLEEGVRAVAIADACYASARTGTVARVERIE